MKLIALLIAILLSGCNDDMDGMMCKLSDGRHISLHEGAGDTYFIRDVNISEYKYITRETK